MKYFITHKTKYTYSQAVPVCHNLVRLAPRILPHQTCDAFRLMIHPEPFDVSYLIDYFGNRVAYFSIDHAHRGLTVTATSEVDVLPCPAVVKENTLPWEEVADRLQTGRTDDVLEAHQFVHHSQRVDGFAELEEYTRRSFTAKRPILDAAIDLTTRIHADFAYSPLSTTIQTPIKEVFEKRKGVCQDFAHLQIGCLRSIGLAARYVSGYLRTEPPPGKPRLVGADASHAWLAVYCGDAGWVDLDPTNDVRVATDHVTLAWGRDYNDICPIQGVIVGGGEHKMNVSVDVLPENELKTPA